MYLRHAGVVAALDEESTGYHLPFDRGLKSLSRQQLGTDDQQARVATWQSQWLAPLHLDTANEIVAPLAQGSLWQRIKLWNVARPGGSQIWLGPAIFCLVYMGIILTIPAIRQM